MILDGIIRRRALGLIGNGFRFAVHAARFPAACFVLLIGLAAAQETKVSTIETEGVAEVETIASQVEFRLNAEFKAPTLLEATNKALEFEPALREALQTAELSPVEMEFSTPVPGDLREATAEPDARIACAFARLRFHAAPFVTGTEGPRDFARLCDKLASIAKNLQARIEGPTLIPQDPETAEQSAIVRAIELAYPPAKAIAGVMKGQVTAVDSVIVQSIEWNTHPSEGTPRAELRKLVCKVKVRVIYGFGAVQ